jgi:organic radical activating enzyme
MSKLKVAELFYSIQGEGRYMGVPSVFLRVFGCNFKCAGFGMPKGELSNEADDIAQVVNLYNKYEELPLVSTGCDSYASWHPDFRHLSPVMDTDTIADAIVDTLPYKEWQDEHLVITGGEPLLGWQRSYPDLLDHAEMDKLSEITFETNGTQAITKEFGKYLTVSVPNCLVQENGGRMPSGQKLCVTIKTMAMFISSLSSAQRRILQMLNVQWKNIVRQVLLVLCILCLLAGLNGCTILIIDQWQKWQCEKDGGTVIDFKCHYSRMSGVHDAVGFSVTSTSGVG